MVTNLLPESNSAGSSFDDANVFNRSNNIGVDEQANDAAYCQENSNAAITQVKCDSQSQRDTKPLAIKQEKLAFKEENCKTKPSTNMDIANRRAGGYLIAVHRKLSRQDTYFLSYHKTRPSLFGVPLLIPCYDDGTNKDLYCAVWVQVARLLSPLPSTPPDQANHATDWYAAIHFLFFLFPFVLSIYLENKLYFE